MGRFASTIPFYEGAREPYGATFFETAARSLGLAGNDRLLDLGAGPGLLAIGFAPFVGEIIGVDPEPMMIEAARAAARREGVRLRLIRGRAEALPLAAGTFDIVTIGRALHWMKPDPTRAELERVVAPEGRILICRAASVDDGRNPWLSAYDKARRRWTETAGAERYQHDPCAFFSGARFRRSRAIISETEQITPMELLVERVLSRSSSSKERLGVRVEQMRAAVLDALAPFARDGLLNEIVEARAEIFVRDRT
ncbi:class I SAM-dependent methyltransferase [Methylocystis sp. SC2]|uniref:class I SAM-dependent methyltransferase n=1 Tax=Methylocystis sp. (strain SC2) TaxID=187303 RepID=UPI0002FAF5ED|nr:class I SAM-dependent methyltransferase [Methylocystis sp. SC2]